MKISPREVRLLMTVGLLVVGVVSYLTVKSAIRQLNGVRNSSQDVANQLERANALVAQRPEWLQSLQRIKSQLPRHPAGRDIKSDLSQQVQALASRSGLILTDSTPEPEVYLGNLDLYQTAIRCNWRGNHENLIQFLMSLQQLGAVIDVERLDMKYRSKDGTQLSGSFTLEFVYSRIGAEKPAPEAAEMEPVS